MRTSLLAGIAVTAIAVAAGAALAAPAKAPAPGAAPRVLQLAQFPGPYPFPPPGPPFFGPPPGPPFFGPPGPPFFGPPGPPFFGPPGPPFFGPPGPYPFPPPGPPFFGPPGPVPYAYPYPPPGPPPVAYPVPVPYPAPAVGAPPFVPSEQIIGRLAPPPGAEVAAERAIDLDIRFAYDSAELLPEARAQLQALATALNSERLRPFRFQIAGHTDATGSNAYNLRLSDARARAVADYLARQFGIERSRMETVGYGEERLKLPGAPTAAENRRVEVRLLGLPENAQAVPGQASGPIKWKH